MTVAQAVADHETQPGTAPQRRPFDLGAFPRQTRAQQIAATLGNAFSDDAFRMHVLAADGARDCGDWRMAEIEYGRALRLFPLHWGYLIQYAHAIKEQGNFPRAEAYYRSAVALGAPADMVDEHLQFVAHRSGSSFVRGAAADLDVAPLLAPPTMHDIGVMIELCGVRRHLDEEAALALLREEPDNRSVLVKLFALPEFARANRAFLDVLRG